jgi:hypothetical protein
MNGQEILLQCHILIAYVVYCDIVSIHCKRRSQYVSKVSSIGYKKQGGPSTEPCGTPLCTLTGRLYDSPTLTQKVRSLKKALIHANRFPVIPRCCNLEINRRLGTRSKAFEKSKYAVSGCLNSCCDGTKVMYLA